MPFILVLNGGSGGPFHLPVFYLLGKSYQHPAFIANYRFPAGIDRLADFQ
jgi:hypothetical protein